MPLPTEFSETPHQLQLLAYSDLQGLPRRRKALDRLNACDINGAGQDSVEPLGSVHFNALYGELRTSNSPVRKIAVAKSIHSDSPSCLRLPPDDTAQYSAGTEQRWAFPTLLSHNVACLAKVNNYCHAVLWLQPCLKGNLTCLSRTWRISAVEKGLLVTSTLHLAQLSSCKAVNISDGTRAVCRDNTGDSRKGSPASFAASHRPSQEREDPDPNIGHDNNSTSYKAEQNQDEMLSPENRLMINSKVAAQRAIFSDPVPRKPGGDLLGARDIAGRWHGRPSAYWSTCCTP